MSEAIQQLEAVVAERNARIEVADDLPRVRANRTALAQAITNLLSNAIKFVPEGIAPRVRVYAEAIEAAVRVWVADNGIGIDPENRERIFTAFERLHGVEEYPGTGIGLAIVRKGVERMGGRVGVESEPGQGNRFWIELPGE